MSKQVTAHIMPDMLKFTTAIGAAGASVAITIDALADGDGTRALAGAAATLFAFAVTGNARLPSARPTTTPVIGQRMPDGMVYAGLAADRKHHLFVEPRDVMDANGRRLSLSFREAHDYARAKGMQLLSIEDMGELVKCADKIGGYDPNAFYWSASDYNNFGAWVQRFTDGSQVIDSDLCRHNVRCAQKTPNHLIIFFSGPRPQQQERHCT